MRPTNTSRSSSSTMFSRCTDGPTRRRQCQTNRPMYLRACGVGLVNSRAQRGRGPLQRNGAIPRGQRVLGSSCGLQLDTEYVSPQFVLGLHDLLHMLPQVLRPHRLQLQSFQALLHQLDKFDAWCLPRMKFNRLIPNRGRYVEFKPLGQQPIPLYIRWVIYPCFPSSTRQCRGSRALAKPLPSFSKIM